VRKSVNTASGINRESQWLNAEKDNRIRKKKTSDR